MGHHPAQAFLVAADTAADLIGPALDGLFGPIRVGNQGAAHGGAVDAAGFELGFHKIRVGEAAHPADRQSGEGTHLIAVFEEAPLGPEIGVAGRGNGIGQGGDAAQPLLLLLGWWGRR